jgi:hypothetical protein
MQEGNCLYSLFFLVAQRAKQVSSDYLQCWKEVTRNSSSKYVQALPNVFIFKVEVKLGLGGFA